MKLSAALALLPAVVLARKTPSQRKIALQNRSVKTTSKMGKKIMSGARKLENGDQEVDFYWAKDYSIKFQGCHHIQQFNEEADGEDEPKIFTKRLVRFRLCPADYCSSVDGGGCDSGYGDYIIDLNIFLEAYWQDKLERQEWDCEYAEEITCAGCNDDEYCEYDCFMENGLDYCVEEDPNQDDDQEEEEEFEVEQYVECAQWDIPDNNRARRQLEDEVEYFIGPYCSDQGGSVYLGVFTDEFCTNFYEDDQSDDKEFYYAMVGKALPYSQESLVGSECLTCKELPEIDADNNNGDNDNNNNNDEQDEDEVIEMCEELYRQAGKCESDMSPDSYYFSPNENACNYMEGIKIMRTDGTVVTKSASASKTAAAFIGIFATSFVLLGAYVYYLKTKLDRAKVDLN